jgi:hypothetical protein
MPKEINSCNELIFNVFPKKYDFTGMKFMTIFGCFIPLILD